MSLEKKKIKPLTIYTIVKIVVIICLCAAVIIGIRSSNNEIKNRTMEISSSKKEHDYVSEDGKIIADFSEPIITKSEEVLKLQFKEQQAETSSDVQQKVLFLKKYQKITYVASVTYTIDLSGITNDNIEIDNNSKSVTISIPKPQYQISLDYDKFRAEDPRSNFFVSLGNEKFTFSEINELEKTAMNKIESKINSEDTVSETESTGIEKAKDLFEPIIKSVDNNYSVNVRYLGE